MKKKQKKTLIKKEETFLRDLFHEWDPIVEGSPLHTPMDEYDCLIHKIVSSLHHDNNQECLETLISDEFINHFGIQVPKSQIMQITEKIWHWWNNNS